jgi:hypothetical protein
LWPVLSKLCDRDGVSTHPDSHRKPDATGLGVFAPAFFVDSAVHFGVVAAQIGMEMEAISAATSVALVAAALRSVLLFPTTARSLPRRLAPEATESEASLAKHGRLALPGGRRQAA